MLRVNRHTSCLLDCGEGTYGQLVKLFAHNGHVSFNAAAQQPLECPPELELPSHSWAALDPVERVLCTLKTVFISHMHADHHLGLLMILKQHHQLRVKLGSWRSDQVRAAPAGDVPTAMDATVVHHDPILAEPINGGGVDAAVITADVSDDTLVSDDEFEQTHPAITASLALPPLQIVGPRLLLPWLKEFAVCAGHAVPISFRFVECGELLPSRVRDSPSVQQNGHGSASASVVPLVAAHATEAGPLITTEPLASTHVLSDYFRTVCALSAVAAVRVHHPADAFGFALTHVEGWKLVYSGDTRPCDTLVEVRDLECVCLQVVITSYMRPL